MHAQDQTTALLDAMVEVSRTWSHVTYEAHAAALDMEQRVAVRRFAHAHLHVGVNIYKATVVTTASLFQEYRKGRGVVSWMWSP